MKSRNGFVSNSSTSSFIIDGVHIDKIARSMLETIITSRMSWIEENEREGQEEKYQKLRESLELALNNPRVLNGEIGIAMKSCNFDTFILIDSDKIYVASSNNYKWDDVVTDGWFVENMDRDDNDGYFQVYDRVADNFFLNIHTNRIHTGNDHINHPNSRCPKCINKIGYCVDTEDNEKLCAWCYDAILEPKEKNE